MKVIALKNLNGPISRLEHEIFDAIDWNENWQGITPSSRKKIGLVVECFGQGEFMQYKIGEDVRILDYVTVPYRL